LLGNLQGERFLPLLLDLEVDELPLRMERPQLRLAVSQGQFEIAELKRQLVVLQDGEFLPGLNPLPIGDVQLQHLPRSSRSYAVMF
jgi:hypothetical protein